MTMSQSPSVSPDQAVQLLKEGNQRFVTGNMSHPRQDEHRRRATAADGQQPFATVLTCSDSRVPVELLFDQGIGDIFVIRVAGNVANVDETACIEYGIAHLHTPLVVVLGHSDCGAVKAVIAGEGSEGHLPALVKNIIAVVEEIREGDREASGQALLDVAIKANLWRSIEDLLKLSPIVASHIKEGKTRVVGALHDLSSGEVQWFGEHPEQDLLLSSH